MPRMNITAYEPEIKSLLEDFRSAKFLYQDMHDAESRQANLIQRRRNVIVSQRARKRPKAISPGPEIPDVTD